MRGTEGICTGAVGCRAATHIHGCFAETFVSDDLPASIMRPVTFDDSAADDLRALSDAATPGPWTVQRRTDTSGLANIVTPWPALWLVNVPITDAAYVVALVNAHRAGEGVAAALADRLTIVKNDLHDETARADALSLQVRDLLAENARLHAQVAAVEKECTDKLGGREGKPAVDYAEDMDDDGDYGPMLALKIRAALAGDDQ